MNKLPKLETWTNPDNGIVFINSKKPNDLTKAEANEIIRRCEAYEGLVKEINRLRHAAGLLNSMVLSGEKHSDVSRKIVKEAFAGKPSEQALSEAEK